MYKIMIIIDGTNIERKVIYKRLILMTLNLRETVLYFQVIISY